MDWEDTSDQMMPPVEEEEQSGMDNFFGSEEEAPVEEGNQPDLLMMSGPGEEPSADMGRESFDGEPEVEITQQEGNFMPTDNMLPIDNTETTDGSFFGHASSIQSDGVARRFEEERREKVKVVDKAMDYKEEFHSKRKSKIEERFKFQKEKELLKQEEETEGEGEGNIWKKVFELVQEDGKIKERKPKKEEKKEGEKKKKIEFLFKKKDISRYYQLIKQYSYGD